VGGVIFGIGMGILGYCPGTLGARIGQGKKEAIVALFGMAFGIFIYALLIRPVKGLLLSSEITGDISVLLGINHWFIILPTALVFSAIIYFVNKRVSDNTTIF
jgi:hypothetical protein